MMQLKIIDGQPFIAVRLGKHESVMTPGEVTTDAQQRIHDAKSCIEQLNHAQQQAQQRLEAAVLASDDQTPPIRAEIDAIGDEIRSHQSDITEATATIAGVARLIDQQKILLIRQQDHARMAGITKPFDDFLKEHRV